MSFLPTIRLNYYILSQLYWRSPKHTKYTELIKKKDLVTNTFTTKAGKTAKDEEIPEIINKI
jgi:hypothetical protein